jgi:hypothetical protein
MEIKIYSRLLRFSEFFTLFVVGAMFLFWLWICPPAIWPRVELILCLVTSLILVIQFLSFRRRIKNPRFIFDQRSIKVSSCLRSKEYDWSEIVGCIRDGRSVTIQTATGLRFNVFPKKSQMSSLVQIIQHRQLLTEKLPHPHGMLSRLRAVISGNSLTIEFALLLLCMSLFFLPYSQSIMLLCATKSSNERAVDILLRTGSDVNFQYQTITPLMLASAEGNNEIVKKLLKKGANVAVQSASGKTALSLAISRRHPSTEKILRQAGATN